MYLVLQATTICQKSVNRLRAFCEAHYEAEPQHYLRLIDGDAPLGASQLLIIVVREIAVRQFPDKRTSPRKQEDSHICDPIVALTLSRSR